jgi:hypothetical protein
VSLDACLLPTSRAVRGVIAARMAAGSARKVSGCTGTTTARIPKYAAALWNAACAVTGTICVWTVNAK